MHSIHLPGCNLRRSHRKIEFDIRLADPPVACPSVAAGGCDAASGGDVLCGAIDAGCISEAHLMTSLTACRCCTVAAGGSDAAGGGSVLRGAVNAGLRLRVRLGHLEGKRGEPPARGLPLHPRQGFFNYVNCLEQNPVWFLRSTLLPGEWALRKETVPDVMCAARAQLVGPTSPCAAPQRQAPNSLGAHC